MVFALSPFGVKLSHMTVWKDMQEQADILEKQQHWKPVRVLGVDGSYTQAKGKKCSVLIVVDP